MDDIVRVPIMVEKTVAYLSRIQAEAYGGAERAVEVLKVDALCEPETLLERTIGAYPWFAEIGHG